MIIGYRPETVTSNCGRLIGSWPERTRQVPLDLDRDGDDWGWEDDTSRQSAVINRHDHTSRAGPGCSRLAHETCRHWQEQTGTATGGTKANALISRRS